ncbi:MAG: TIM barrel protein [Deltaproteobacteria bacterium]|nr:TIM barrel protein [Deltaproteobacteria bacterium]
MTTTRRSFLAALGAGVALACDDSPIDTRRRVPRLGIQLYTMRAELARDLRGTLARLAAMGYRDVETAGTYLGSAADLRRILDELALESSSAHLPLAAFEREETFDDARVMRQRWLTVSSPPAPAPVTRDDWSRVADALGAAATKAKARGFRFAYHNHAGELARVGDTTGLDILLARTDPELVSFQMDLYWAVTGGADPRALLARFGPRFTMLHVKDSSGGATPAIVDVGAGTIDFAAIFAATTSVEGYFVEHDVPRDAFATAEASARYLAALRF